MKQSPGSSRSRTSRGLSRLVRFAARHKPCYGYIGKKIANNDRAVFNHAFELCRDRHYTDTRRRSWLAGGSSFLGVMRLHCPIISMPPRHIFVLYRVECGNQSLSTLLKYCLLCAAFRSHQPHRRQCVVRVLCSQSLLYRIASHRILLKKELVLLYAVPSIVPYTSGIKDSSRQPPQSIHNPDFATVHSISVSLLPRPTVRTRFRKLSQSPSTVTPIIPQCSAAQRSAVQLSST